MGTPTPVKALEGFTNAAVQRYVVSRQILPPYIEKPEAFLAVDRAEAETYAADLHEETRLVIESVLEGGKGEKLYAKLLAASRDLVKVTPVSVRPLTRH